jgi:uncharacterized membrane protein YidH (DUF202 family)
MRNWIRRGLQVGDIGCVVMGAGAVWIVVLALVDRAAIVGLPLVTLCAGITLILAGMTTVEVASWRRRRREERKP